MLFAVPIIRAARSPILSFAKAQISARGLAVPTASILQRISCTQSNGSSSNERYHGNSSLLAIVSATLATSCALSVSTCESARPADEPDGFQNNNFTFNDGPCRKHMLQLQKCMKEHSDDDKEKDEGNHEIECDKSTEKVSLLHIKLFILGVLRLHKKQLSCSC